MVFARPAPDDLVTAFMCAMERSPAHVAVSAGKCRLSYVELSNAVANCAHFLQQSISRGDLVGLYLGRTPEYVIAYLATAAIGAIIVPFDTETPGAGVAAEADALGLRAVITNDPEHRSGLPNPIVVEASGTRTGRVPWTAEGTTSRTAPRPAPADPDSVLVLLRTSGSTSAPKRVALTHRNALSSSRAHRQSVGHERAEVSLAVLPMSFGYCHCTQLVAQLDTGGTLALLPGLFSPQAFAAAASAVQATGTTLVPSMLTLLDRAPTRLDRSLGSLRRVVFGGAPVDPSTLERLRKRLPDIEFIETYGQTEAGPRISTLRAAEGATRQGSVGRAIPGMRIEIRDVHGKALSPGEIGEITVRGPGVMTGYFGDAAASSTVLRGGWLHTGDVGRLDEDGFLWLVGRLRNLIITGGRNLVPEEVEQHLRQMPGIDDAAVFGRPDELRGQSVHALVVAASTAPTEREVRAFLGARLETYKVPRTISFVREIPRTTNGKVDRAGLGDRAAKEAVQ
jgi:long-chain acyl-CoA synthetase